MCCSKRRIILLGILLAGLLGISFLAQGQEEKGYSFSPDKRDPFSPLISRGGYILIPKEIDIAGLNLKGIIYSDGGSVAVINNEILKAGDKIGEYRIARIEEKLVVLEKGGKEFTLKLEEE